MQSSKLTSINESMPHPPLYEAILASTPQDRAAAVYSLKQRIARLEPLSTFSSDLLRAVTIEEILHVQSLINYLETFQPTPLVSSLVPSSPVPSSLESPTYDYKSMLNQFTQKHKLPLPKYSPINVHLPHDPHWIANVMVGTFQFTTHPTWFTTKVAAEKHAAYLALTQFPSPERVINQHSTHTMSMTHPRIVGFNMYGNGQTKRPASPLRLVSKFYALWSGPNHTLSTFTEDTDEEVFMITSSGSEHSFITNEFKRSATFEQQHYDYWSDDIGRDYFGVRHRQMVEFDEANLTNWCYDRKDDWHADRARKYYRCPDFEPHPTGLSIGKNSVGMQLRSDRYLAQLVPFFCGDTFNYGFFFIAIDAGTYIYNYIMLNEHKPTLLVLFNFIFGKLWDFNYRATGIKNHALQMTRYHRDVFKPQGPIVNKFVSQVCYSMDTCMVSERSLACLRALDYHYPGLNIIEFLPPTQDSKDHWMAMYHNPKDYHKAYKHLWYPLYLKYSRFWQLASYVSKDKFLEFLYGTGNPHYHEYLLRLDSVLGIADQPDMPMTKFMGSFNPYGNGQFDGLKENRRATRTRKDLHSHSNRLNKEWSTLTSPHKFRHFGTLSEAVLRFGQIYSEKGWTSYPSHHVSQSLHDLAISVYVAGHPLPQCGQVYKSQRIIWPNDDPEPGIKIRRLLVRTYFRNRGRITRAIKHKPDPQEFTISEEHVLAIAERVRNEMNQPTPTTTTTSSTSTKTTGVVSSMISSLSSTAGSGLIDGMRSSLMSIFSEIKKQATDFFHGATGWMQENIMYVVTFAVAMCIFTPAGVLTLLSYMGERAPPDDVVINEMDGDESPEVNGKVKRFFLVIWAQKLGEWLFGVKDMIPSLDMLNKFALQVKNISELCRTIGSTFYQLIDWVCQTFTGIPFFESSKKAKIMQDSMTTFLKFETKSERDKLGVDITSCQEVIHSYESLRDNIMSLKIWANGPVHTQLMQALIRGYPLYAQACFTVRNRRRLPPSTIHLVGKPNQGKSVMMTMLISCIYQFVRGEQMFNNNRYERKQTEEFWSGYCGQFCTTLDDILQPVDAENRCKQILEYIYMVNDADYPLNMPGISEKGNTMFTSQLVVTTSNVIDMAEYKNLGITEDGAFFRRIDHWIEVKLKPNVKRCKRPSLNDRFNWDLVSVTHDKGQETRVPITFDDLAALVADEIVNAKTEEGKSPINYAPLAEKQCSTCKLFKCKCPEQYFTDEDELALYQEFAKLRKVMNGQSEREAFDAYKDITCRLTDIPSKTKCEIVKSVIEASVSAAMPTPTQVVVNEMDCFEDIDEERDAVRYSSPFEEDRKHPVLMKETISVYCPDSHTKVPCTWKMHIDDFDEEWNRKWQDSTWKPHSLDRWRVFRKAYLNDAADKLRSEFKLALTGNEAFSQPRCTPEELTAFTDELEVRALVYTNENNRLALWWSRYHKCIEVRKLALSFALGVVVSGIVVAGVYLIKQFFSPTEFVTDESSDEHHKRQLFRQQRHRPGKLPRHATVKNQMMDANGEDLADLIAGENQFAATFVHRNSEKTFCNALCIEGRVYAIPSHTWLAHGGIESMQLLFDANNKADIVINSFELLKLDTDRDLCLIFCPQAPLRPSLYRHLMSSYLSGEVDGPVRISFSGMYPHLHEGSTASKLTRPVATENPNGEDTGLRSGLYRLRNMQGGSGECGGACLLFNHSYPKKLLGYHSGSSGRDCFATPILTTDIDECREKLKKKSDSRISTMYVEAEEEDERLNGLGFSRAKVKKFVPERKDQKEFEKVLNEVGDPVHPGLRFVASLKKRAHMPGETVFRPTIIQTGTYTGDNRKGHWLEPPFDVGERPAVLRKITADDGSVLDPLTLSLRKFQTKRVLEPPPEFFNSKNWDGVFGEADLSRVRELTLEEAAFGCRECHLPPIELDTSVGTPENISHTIQTRRAWLRRPSDKEPDGWIHPLLRARVTRIRSMLTSGRIPRHFVTGCLKDELRPLDRVKKAYTRLFLNGELAFLLAMRMDLGYLMMLVEHNRFSDIQVGVNPYSMDWKILYERLTRFDDGTAVDHDVDGWDINFSHHVAYGFVKEFAFRKGISMNDDWCVRMFGLLYATFTPYVILGDKIFWTIMMPSGSLATSFFNTVFHSVKIRTIFQILAKERNLDMNFDEFVTALLFGDDSIITIAKQVFPWFNGITIASAALKYFNHVHTASDKSNIIVNGKKLADANFLQRKFIPKDGLVLCPLSETPLISMTQWVRYSKTQSLDVQFKTNCDNALREWYFHGEEKYNRMQRIYNTFLTSIRSDWINNRSYAEAATSHQWSYLSD